MIGSRRAFGSRRRLSVAGGRAQILAASVGAANRTANSCLSLNGARPTPYGGPCKAIRKWAERDGRA